MSGRALAHLRYTLSLHKLLIVGLRQDRFNIDMLQLCNPLSIIDPFLIMLDKADSETQWSPSMTTVITGITMGLAICFSEKERISIFRQLKKQVFKMNKLHL